MGEPARVARVVRAAQAVNQNGNAVARLPAGGRRVVQHDAVAARDGNETLDCGLTESRAAQHVSQDGLHVSVAQQPRRLENRRR